jgi:CheY-like chemotaxis protein
MAVAPDRFHDGEIRVLAARLLRPSPVRVLIADDDDLFAEALALVLAREDRIEIVGIARNGREALEQAMWSRPDVVVMDLHMPVIDGVEATRRIGARRSRVPGRLPNGLDRARGRDAGARSRRPPLRPQGRRPVGDRRGGALVRVARPAAAAAREELQMSTTLLAPALSHNPERTIERILDLARRQLEMDVALVGRFEDDAEVVRAVAGDAESFGFTDDLRVPLEDTYCERVVDGRLAGIVRDAQQNPIVRDLPVTREARIGSYVGVPVRLWNGRVYGTLCCLGHDPDPSLDERDLRFMNVLAQLIADELDRESLEVHKRSIEAERIRRVIARHDIDMVFQPVYDIRDGAPVALETLARFWDEPNRPPAAWFAEAEEVGPVTPPSVSVPSPPSLP